MEPINRSPSFGQSGRTMLQTCISSHTNCPKPSGTFIPTRLVEIRATKDQRMKARLIKTEAGRCYNYAALSYCWGGDQSYKTCAGNLTTYEDEIPFESLALTIQHAIKEVSDLGIDYLWVDSLCIQQDNQTEKAVEISRMADVYSEAAVTLLVQRAAHAADGFMHGRNGCEGAVSLPLRVEDGITIRVGLLRGDSFSVKDYLRSRGWTLQERLMSVRVIEYGDLQTKWTCMETQRADGFGMNNDNSGSDIQRYINYRGHAPKFGNCPSLVDHEKFSRNWRQVVEDYSCRKLTDQADRLPAIAAIACGFASLLPENSRYVAGHWLDFLSSSLCWKVREITIFESTGLGLEPRPEPATAPTWSWASVTTPNGIDMRPPAVSYPTTPPAVLVEILSCTVSLRTLAAGPFGPASAGVLRIRGRTLRGKWVGPSLLEVDGGWNRPTIFRDALEPEDSMVGDDCRFLNAVPVLLVICQAVIFEDPTVLEGLVLRLTPSVSTPPLYSRIGVFTIYQQSMVNRLEINESGRYITKLSRVDTVDIEKCGLRDLTII